MTAVKLRALAKLRHLHSIKMDACFNFLGKKSFHRLTLVGVFIFAITGTSILAALLVNELREADTFRCYTTADKKTSDNLRDDCYDEYNKQFNKKFPLYAFVFLNIPLVLLVCVVYSQYVKPRVDTLDNADNGDPERNQRNAAAQQSTLRYKVFTAYVAHLLIRSTLLALFLILQWGVLYPVTFPAAFTCPTIQDNNSTAAGLNSNSTAAHYSCKNAQANTKTICGFALFAVNVLFLGLSLVEMICLLYKAAKDKTFIEDRKFCQCHLIGKENACPREIPLQVMAYIESLKRRIIDDTENIKPLIPEIKDKSIKLDEIFVNLVIQTGRKIHQLCNQDRDAILQSYPKPDSGSVALEKAEEIFAPNKDTQDPRTILAVGRAGIGKTLLATKILRDWANGVLSTANQAAKSFDFIFLLQFRWLNFDKDIPLIELLRRSPYSVDFTDEMFQHVKKNPEKVLLVFDGLDEAKELGSIGTEQEHNNSTSEAMPVGALFAKLASGKLLNGATVLTTTRSTVLPGVVSRFYSELNQEKLRIVEILGFTPEKVEEYVNKFVPEAMKDDIWNHISANANLLSLCYIPVNCFIVCSNLMNILQNQEQPGATAATTHVSPTLPTTLTEIYKGALNCFMLSRHSLYRNERPTRREFNPDSKFRPSVKETLNKLGKLAMKGLEEGRLIFDEKEIMESAQLTEEELKDMVESSLLHHLPESKTGASKYQEQYCFIHLTFQEFLAARVIAHKASEELADFTKSAMSRNDSKMELVLRFVAGLLRGRKNTDCIDSLLQPLITKCLERPKEAQSLLLLLQCLFELHSDEKTTQVSSKFKETGFCFSGSSINDTDCSSLVFFFKHLSGIKLDLRHNTIGPCGCTELAKLVEGGNLNILNISHTNVGDEGLKSVSEALQSEKCKLQTLKISVNGITAVGARHLSDALKTKQCQLTELNLSGNQLTDKGVEYLSDALVNCKLKILRLASNEITVVGAQHLSKALKSERCQLTSLKLDRNQLTNESLKHLSDALVNCQLKMLSIQCVNGITAVGVKHLSNALKSEQCQLIELHMYQIVLNNDGVKHLSDALVNSKLKVLSIGHNSITAVGAQHLSNALRSEQCQLTELDCSGNQLTDEGVACVCNALVSGNCKLTKLELLKIGMTDKGGMLLVEALQSRECKLTELKFYPNNLSDDCLSRLEEVLKPKH